MGEIYRITAAAFASPPSCMATSPQASIIFTGLRNYGGIVADNASYNWELIGTPDARWNDSDLACLAQVKGSMWEPVNVSSLIAYPALLTPLDIGSYQAIQPSSATQVIGAGLAGAMVR